MIQVADRGRKPGAPGFFFARALAALLALALLAACNPWNWREQRAPDGFWVGALPDRPQIVEREVDYLGRPLTMRVSSTGVGATLFAISEIRLPPEIARDPAACAALVDWLAARLLANARGSDPRSAPFAASLPPRRELRLARSLEARALLGRESRPGVLAARWWVVDDRLIQLAVLGADGDLPVDATENFFTAFRFLPPS